MSDARAEVLARVKRALAGAPVPVAAPRDYRRAGSRAPEERVALFAERVDEYRTEVQRVAESEVAAAVAATGARRLVVAPGVPASWRPPSLELVEDDGLGPHELDALDGVLTGCTAAVAETGTIILTGEPHEGRRALTLVPDLHICVVLERQIHELLPEALDAIAGSSDRPITFISGPSATSDIELSRVEGVHGPRTLVVLIAKERS